MKSKYSIWIVGLLALSSCTKLSCDFTYSPTAPAAGEIVSFSNQSTGADDYYWTFGDNGTSTASSPTHIYRKPGTYTVTLQIIRNKVEKRHTTQYITIIDTIPTIACDSDTVYSFTPITFTAQVYNPWKKTATYHWVLPDYAVVLAGKNCDSSAVVCYFTQDNQDGQVGLEIQLGNDTPAYPTYTFTTAHTMGTSVVYAANISDTLEQYTYIIHKKRVFMNPRPSILKENQSALRMEQDTSYVYGTKTYTRDMVTQLLGQDIKGFQVDRLMGKIYAYCSTGLWVCNITGANPRQLTTTAIQAIKVDGDGNCLYWATANGLYVHPLFMTADNLEPFTPTLVTSLSSITRISVNSNLH